MAKTPRHLPPRVERQGPSISQDIQPISSITRPHTTAVLDSILGLNGNVVAEEFLSGGSWVRGTHVKRLDLREPVDFGEFKARKIVVKWADDGSKEDNDAMDREGDTLTQEGRRRHAMPDHLLPAKVIRLPNGHYAVAMPFLEDHMSLREGIDIFPEEVIQQVQKEVVLRTVDFMSKHLLSGQRRRGVEIVSMKRIEREQIWEAMQTANKNTATALGLLKNWTKATLMFTEHDSQSGEPVQVEYPSLFTMQHAANQFLRKRPTVVATDTNHDDSMKNTMKHAYKDADDPTKFYIVDHGYKARENEGVDPAEAILVGSKVDSLDILERKGEVKAHFEFEGETNKVVVDVMDIVPKAKAVRIENYLRELWTKENFSIKLGYPKLLEDLAMWEVISCLYEYTYAGKRAAEKDKNGKVIRERPDAGMYMLRKAGRAFKRYEGLRQVRKAAEMSGSSRRQITALSA